MNDIKFIISSIIFSAVIHFSVIYYLNIEKKDTEVYVVNLSEFRDFSISSPAVKKSKPIEQNPKKEIPKKEIPKKEIPKKIVKKKGCGFIEKKN